MKLNRIIYFLYYLKRLNKSDYFKYLQYVKLSTNRSTIRILLDVFSSVYIYNISILDYFYFGFFEKRRNERKTWAGTGYMYEYQLGMNPKGAREILEDKILFLNSFKDFIRREYFSLNEVEGDLKHVADMLSNSSGRVVLKNSHGQVGAEVEVISCHDYRPQSLIEYMKKKNYNLVEEYVIQHKSLMELSPTGLNTIRIFTQLHKGKVGILGARLRISVNSPVDNMGAGNLAASVDIETGVVNGPGVYSDITKEDQEIHPITKRFIKGFSIPFWKDTVNLVERAALHRPENKSIGWDIAITEIGPELIEGNHNWCKLLWQLPVKQGLKAELQQYM